MSTEGSDDKTKAKTKVKDKERGGRIDENERIATSFSMISCHVSDDISKGSGEGRGEEKEETVFISCSLKGLDIVDRYISSYQVFIAICNGTTDQPVQLTVFPLKGLVRREPQTWETQHSDRQDKNKNKNKNKPNKKS